MLQITSLTDDYRQTFSAEIEDGTSFLCALDYSEEQQCWFCDITYKKKIINGIKMVTAGNLLASYKNILPFGLLINNEDNLDPYLLDSFIDDTNIYILNSTEVAQIV